MKGPYPKLKTGNLVRIREKNKPIVIGRVCRDYIKSERYIQVFVLNMMTYELSTTPLKIDRSRVIVDRLR